MVMLATIEFHKHYWYEVCIVRDKKAKIKYAQFADSCFIIPLHMQLPCLRGLYIKYNNYWIK